MIEELASREGMVVGLQRSGGGVPKLPVDRVEVRLAGMVGDWQQDRRHHGGPDRALCLYSMDLMDALVAEGHPISAGSTGENVTVRGIHWSTLTPGTRLQLGNVEVEVTAFADPCRTIAGSFLKRRIARISEKANPGWSRVYVRILREGVIAVGDSARVI
jgi:MOSC domain-containing protein YiiM